MEWVEFKEYLSQVTDLDQDSLHVYAALLIQLGAAALLRRPVAHPAPWLAVLAVLTVNEAIDLGAGGRGIEPWQILGGLRDLLNTMALPTVLLLAARYTPGLLTGPAPAAAAAGAERSDER